MEGAIAALREAREPGDVALVVNELTVDTSKALADRYVTMAISTPVETLCRDLVRLMAAAIAKEPADLSGQHFLQPEIFLPESV